MDRISKTAPPIKLKVSKEPQKGDFTSIQAAVLAAEALKAPCEITIASGVYQEQVKIYKNQLTLIAEPNTFLCYHLAAEQTDEKGQKRGTFQTATLFINSREVFVKNLTIINDAGYGQAVGQAVAVYIEGDDIRFERCHLDAFQDTLCLGPLPKNTKEGEPMISPWRKTIFDQQQSLFLHCRISGTVDFIFGGGSATFEECRLHCKNTPQTNYVTAASTSKQASGLTFDRCRVTGDKAYYLGRPWRNDAKVTFLSCCFDQQLAPCGWSDWGKTASHQTVTFTERMCCYQRSPQRPEWVTLEGVIEK
ncbi:pectinesterase family protein [Enterococcus casseliflavus]|uniref:pectinesterase family protein n=1 Tax=Enterococcus casseliflavus TaxID=37734 RepID=UPI0022E0C9A2|nr:pectinesterase family protein [Enterococcus casseliflavus]